MESIEDMRTTIQEWMSQAHTTAQLARTYAAIYMELEQQLEICSVARQVEVKI